MSLRSKRLEKGLRQIDAAAICGITQQRLSHYETGIRQPKGEMLKIIAEAYKCTVDELLEDDDKIRAGKEVDEAIGSR